MNVTTNWNTVTAGSLDGSEFTPLAGGNLVDKFAGIPGYTTLPLSGSTWPSSVTTGDATQQYASGKAATPVDFGAIQYRTAPAACTPTYKCCASCATNAQPSLNGSCTSPQVCCGTCVTAPPADLCSGLSLLHHYDNSTPTDSSGNSNHGTVSGAVWTGSGKFTGAFDFSGTGDRITCPDSPSLSPAGQALTLNAWIYLPAAQDDGDRLIHKNGSWNLQIGAGGRRPSFGLYQGGFLEREADLECPLSQWCMVTGSYNGTDMTLYVNGAPAGSAAKSGNLLDSPDSLYLGLDEDGSTYDYNGLLDEPTVWNRSLSAAEVLSLYQRSTALACADTVKPLVTLFTVTPQNPTNSVTANYTVTDDTALSSVQLYRAPFNPTNCTDTVKTGCVWTQVPPTQTASGKGPVSGQLTDTPPVGTSYYGLHVKDAAGNTGYEPTPPGPIKVVKTSTVPTACHIMTPSSPLIPNFGSAYNVAENRPDELLLAPLCTGTGVNITAGTGAANQYIYKTAYIWKNNAWQPFTLSGQTSAYQDWIAGQGRATFALTAAELANYNYIVVYICQRINNAWKCGCRDTACGTSHWQPQIFKQ